MASASRTYPGLSSVVLSGHSNLRFALAACGDGRILALPPNSDVVWCAGLRSGAFLEGSRLKPVANRRSGAVSGCARGDGDFSLGIVDFGGLFEGGRRYDEKEISPFNRP